MAEQVQAEAGVVEEGEVRAGVGQRDQAGRVAQHAAHRGLVGVEQQRVEHRVEVLGEREIEHEVERVLVRGARELGDRALLGSCAGLDDLDLAPIRR